MTKMLGVHHVNAARRLVDLRAAWGAAGRNTDDARALEGVQHRRTIDTCPLHEVLFFLSRLEASSEAFLMSS